MTTMNWAKAAVMATAMAVLSMIAPAIHDHPAIAQEPRDAAVLLVRAQHREMVDGDLRAAIRMYQDIADMKPVDRVVAARALVYLGRSYDRLGDAAARNAYERIVAEYADQRDALKIARERLASLSPDSARKSRGIVGDPTFTLLFNNQTDFNLGEVDYSPDGRRFVAVAPKDRGPAKGTPGLYVSDAAGAGVRPLLEDWGVHLYHWPRWSPDGARIVYEAHVNPNVSTEYGIFGVYVVSVDGSEPIQVAPDTEIRYHSPIWTAAGNVTFSSGVSADFVTVDLSGDTIRVVSVVATHGPNAIDVDRGVLAGEYSPDGNWLAFQAISTEGAPGIWVMPATGGRAHHLVPIVRGGYATGRKMTWGADGGSIYFIGHASGDPNIWEVGFDSRSGERQGEPEAVTSYDDVEVRFPKMLASGGIAYVVISRTNSVLVANTSRSSETRTLARGTAPQITPDGRFVYYVGEGHGREGLFVIPTAGGDPRRVTSTVPAHSRFGLSPDGTAISFHTHVGGETSLFVLPVQGGEPRLVAHFESRAADSPVWSPDGSRLAFAHGEDLFVVGEQGGEPERIAQVRAWESFSLTWSPDGNYVAGFGYAEGEQSNAIFVVPANGGELRRLTPPEEDKYKEGLSWHPDGQRLSYMYYDPDGSRMAYLDGRPTTLLVDQPGLHWDYVGHWTPDGRTYLFISAIQGFGNRSGIYAYDEETGRTTEFYSSTSGNTLPRNWSRDGRMFSLGNTRTTQQIWLMEDFQ